MTDAFHTDKFSRIFHADSRVLLPTMKDAMFDSVVTDPPYELGFMGKAWDSTGVAYDVSFWREVLKVAKPGAHLLAFGGTRTFHRLACAIEDAGWEYRDTIMWVYGSGFPKSLNIGKAIDKAAGAEREVVHIVPARMPQAQAQGWGNPGTDEFRDARRGTVDMPVTAPATPEAQQWDGWGTALKPAWEPIIVARKPLEGTVAANVLAYGTGGINIDGCRIGTDIIVSQSPPQFRSSGKGGEGRTNDGRDSGNWDTYLERAKEQEPHIGRWPANLIHDGSEEVLALFPAEAGGGFGVRGGRTDDNGYGLGGTREIIGHGDSGSAARFFYCAKPSARERKHGLAFEGVEGSHTTVKPLALMSYLVRLVTRPDGLVLDPFLGSGTTRLACRAEGMRCVGIEQDEGYCKIAAARG